MTMLSQENNLDKVAVKSSIETFFEGFHQQDSLKMKAMVYENIELFSVKKVDNLYSLDKSDFSSFLKSIVSIPKNIKFEEVLSNYNIQVNGGLAQVWVNYTFYINEQVSHCGINSFQLYKDVDGIWKIIFLGDTRQKICN